MTAVWRAFVVAFLVAAFLPAPEVFAQGRRPRPRPPVEPAYEDDYADEYGDEYGDEGEDPEGFYGDEGYDEEWPEEGAYPEEGGLRGEGSGRPVDPRTAILRERAINPAAPRWNWGPWAQLRVRSGPTLPVGLFLARGRHELGFGYSFQGGFVDPEDFNDTSVQETESGYSALELNYRHFFGGDGEGLWVGGGAALVSYDVEIKTSRGEQGDTSSTFNVLRLGTGFQWRAGSFEFGVGAGLDFTPDTEATVTASNSLSRITTKADLDSGTGFYLVVSAGYRF